MRRLERGDAVRIPLGLVIGWLAAVGLWKGVTGVEAEPVSIIVMILAVAISLVFLGIALVMVFGWLAGGDE